MLPEERVAAAGEGIVLPLTTRPVGRKKLVPARRSISCISAAASSGGKASSSRNAVTSCAQTKNGMRMKVMPGARTARSSTMMLIAEATT